MMRPRPILTSAEMRAAEQAAISQGTSEALLMERAGRAAAEAIRRYAGHMPALVLCGPGNNGGDGYVVARRLKDMGLPVRVAALGEPSHEPALGARKAWDGRVEAFEDATPAPLLIDALFGTGLSRGLGDAVAGRLGAFAAQASIRIAMDLPSGINADTGAILSSVPAYDLTITFGSLKPGHMLQPGAALVGRVVVADIGVVCGSELVEVAKPRLIAPGPQDHKYRRGFVTVHAGAMRGAAALVASAAARAGAGYVGIVGSDVRDLPHAVVQGVGADDPRIGALVIGPGLGRDEHARQSLSAALAGDAGLVLDADALHLLPPGPLPGEPILTPHAGEFAAAFGDLPGSKVEQARTSAASVKAVVLFKGADTVIAAPDGRAAIIAPPAWLSTAGTGDVLAGIAGAMRARGMEPFEAACAAAWLHARAAQLAGPGLIADDLLPHIKTALGECI